VVSLVLVLTLFACAWGCLAWRQQRFDIADMAWGVAPVLAVWTVLWQSPISTAGILITTMVTLWGLRLGWHLYLRRSPHTDDFRYIELRTSWQQRPLRHFILKVVLLQSVLAFLLVAPSLWIILHGQQISPSWLLVGAGYWLAGFIIETAADIQLHAFLRLHPGQLMRGGLWRLSRHPNLFGELLQWWALAAVAATTINGIYFLLSPIIISIIVVQVSGVVPLEQRLRHKPGFSEYCRETPRLIPLFAVAAAIYSLCWSYTLLGRDRPPLLAGLLNLSAATALFAYLRRHHSLLAAVAAPLTIFVTAIGLLSELCMYQFNLLHYSVDWTPIITLYPPFALCLLTGTANIRLRVWHTLTIGAAASVALYWAAAQLATVEVYNWWALALVWAGIFTISWHYLCQLMVRAQHLAASDRLQQPLQVIFDGRCPICRREKSSLQRRRQTGQVIYSCPTSAQELQGQRPELPYAKAMRSIHAYLDREELTGIDALAELYARTDLLWLAVLLKAPLFYSLSRLLYAIWAALRPRDQGL